MSEETFEIKDHVIVRGESGIWTIKGTRTPEPRFLVQQGTNATTAKWVATEALAIVQKSQSNALFADQIIG